MDHADLLGPLVGGGVECALPGQPGARPDRAFGGLRPAHPDRLRPRSNTVSVLLTTDHGSIHCHTPATVFAKRDATANLRYKFGEDLRAERSDAAILVKDLPAWGLPDRGLGVRMLLATGDRFFVYPTKLREYQARYRGAFLHGGVTPEEVILPIALLTPRRGR